MSAAYDGGIAQGDTWVWTNIGGRWNSYPLPALWGPRKDQNASHNGAVCSPLTVQDGSVVRITCCSDSAMTRTFLVSFSNSSMPSARVALSWNGRLSDPVQN